jgi:hypothetical protein
LNRARVSNPYRSSFLRPSKLQDLDAPFSPSIYISMELPKLTGRSQPRPIPRSLSVSPDYRPDWRFQVMEQYAVEISKADDQSAKFEALLLAEGDPYVRQLLNFHIGRRCLISGSIEYALRCRASNSINRIGSALKAMTVAGRTSDQIAADLGTEASKIRCYQHLFFDVKRYLDRRVWLKSICFPVLSTFASEEEQCEATWLATAYLRGWPGLCPLVSLTAAPPNGRAELARLIQILLGRTVDYLEIRQSLGVPPSERDLHCLALMQHRIQGLGLPLKMEDLKYLEPHSSEEEKRQRESDELIKNLPAQSRRNIRALFERLGQIAPVNVKKEA